MSDNEEKFDKIKYDNNYRKEHFDTITIRVKKGDKSYIKQSAQDLGYSNLNSFIFDAIKEKIANS